MTSAKKWTFINKNLPMSKELGDLLALNLSEMMTGPRDVKCSEPPKAEKSPSGTQPNDTSPGSRDVPLLGKKIVH